MATLLATYAASNPALFRKAVAANAAGWSRTGQITPEAAATVLRNVAKFDSSINPSGIDLGKTYAPQFAAHALQKYSQSCRQPWH